jgi:hypothetical protein
LGRCPHLLNLTAKPKRSSKKGEKLDLAYVLPTPKLIEEGRPYHFPSYTMSSINQANKEKKCTIKLENEGGGVRNSYQIPQRGLEVLCVSLWGSQEPPTRFDIPAKLASFAC